MSLSDITSQSGATRAEDPQLRDVLLDLGGGATRMMLLVDPSRHDRAYIPQQASRMDRSVEAGEP